MKKYWNKKKVSKMAKIISLDEKRAEYEVGYFIPFATGISQDGRIELSIVAADKFISRKDKKKLVI